MQSVKNELLAALAAELDKISPGAGEKAAFESPKQAAHGDLAVTAAMQLAKPLKSNPRALGEQLKAALEATPAFQRWVDAIELAGPGFLNIRLKPAAKQQIVRGRQTATRLESVDAIREERTACRAGGRAGKNRARRGRQGRV